MADPDDVRLVDRPEAADRAAAVLRDAPWLAVDTEFHAERRYRPELLLVQVHVPGGETFLFDPLVPGVIARVADALRAAPAWVLHAGYQDLRLLDDALGGLPRRVWDTQLGAGLVDPVYPAGFEALCGRWLDLRVDKTARMSDWTRRPLSTEQQAYAAADVRWLPALFASIRAEVERRDRVGALEAACAEAVDDALANDPLPTALRRVAAGADLVPADLAILRELVAWREAVAAEQDRPPVYLLGDATLRDLARTHPTDLAALEANRRLSDRMLHRHGRALLDAIARGRAASTDGLPVVVRRHTAEARRAAFLETVAVVLGGARHFGAPLVLPRDRLEALCAIPAPERADTRRILGDWRDDLAGDIVHDALTGEIGLSAGGGDVLLTRCPPIQRKTEHR
jgi:ribonuclease D